jgi:hypothetical protein
MLGGQDGEEALRIVLEPDEEGQPLRYTWPDGTIQEMTSSNDSMVVWKTTNLSPNLQFMWHRVAKFPDAKNAWDGWWIDYEVMCEFTVDADYSLPMVMPGDLSEKVQVQLEYSWKRGRICLRRPDGTLQEVVKRQDGMVAWRTPSYINPQFMWQRLADDEGGPDRKEDSAESYCSGHGSSEAFKTAQKYESPWKPVAGAASPARSEPSSSSSNTLQRLRLHAEPTPAAAAALDAQSPATVEMAPKKKCRSGTPKKKTRSGARKQIPEECKTQQKGCSDSEAAPAKGIAAGDRPTKSRSGKRKR